VLERLSDGSLGEVAVLLDNAALASQAIGPPLSGVEMSWSGREWRDVGRRLLPRTPLAHQFVDPTDSVLGDKVRYAGPGLEHGNSYERMVRGAFDPRWWSATARTAAGYTQMEENFSLFFGLAVLCYEATLIPDEAPFDRFRRGQVNALDESQQRGMSLFLGRGRCVTCHGSPLFAGSLRDEITHTAPDEGEGILERMFMQNAITTAALLFATEPGQGERPLNFNPFQRTVALLDASGVSLAWVRLPTGQRCPPAGEQRFALEPTAFLPAGSEFAGSVRITSDGQCGLRLRVDVEWGVNGPPGGSYRIGIGGLRFPLEVPPPSQQAVYDNGFYNIGVRPSTEDAGVGGDGPFGPLAITRRVQRGEDIGQNPGFVTVSPGERIAVNGAFKTPTLRNVELTGPYMHNGGMATLEQVVEFYTRASDFGDVNFRDKDIDVSGIVDMSEQDKADLVAFLKSLTDPRVRLEMAPFDHPELPLKVGHLGDDGGVVDDGTGNALLDIEIRPATGRRGGTALRPFADKLPASITVVVTREDAAEAEVAFVCDKKPSAPVTLALTLAPTNVATHFPLELTFTPEDWRVTQRVRLVRAATTPLPSGGAPVTLVTSSAVSADPAFAGLAVDDAALDFVPGTAALRRDAAPRAPAPAPSASAIREVRR